MDSDDGASRRSGGGRSRAAVSLRLAPRPDAPAEARRSLRNACWDVPATVLYDAELLTSEIVTNAVRHARQVITIDIECDERSLAVAVADDCPDVPVVKSVGTNHISGRGMRLVDRLAAAWGCRPSKDGTGKVVWFRVAV
jgi:anti-sigma regulatory factor (Ser/Thr protein kinase)